MKLNPDNLLKWVKETHPSIYHRLLTAYKGSKKIGEEE